MKSVDSGYMLENNIVADRVIDAHVGKRLRVARKMAKLSQNALGSQVSLTFQQIQKHESGDVRISAGRLMKLSKALGVPFTFFFEGLEINDDSENAGNENVLNLADLSEVKSNCVRLIAEADEKDVASITNVLERMPSVVRVLSA